MRQHTDIAIVGAGIVGLAHAYHAVRKGLTVAVFDRSARAQGASTRNFGMLAIVAQAEGAQLDSALRGLEHWKQVARSADIALEQTGCLFLAREPVELQVLDEFVRSRHSQAAGSNGKRVSGEQASERMLRRTDLPGYAAMPESASALGGAWSDDAWKLDQRSAVAKLALWLQREHGVQFFFESEVTAVAATGLETVELQAVSAVDGASAKAIVHRCNHTIVCGGNDFSTLFPEAFAGTGISHCELQMLRTVAQPANWLLKPFILGGLSISRYSSFEQCPALPELVEHQQVNQREYLQHGIHLIACQEADGSITIGDSHKYETQISQTQSIIPLSKQPLRLSPKQPSNRSAKIDELMLAELNRMITVPNVQIAERWLGHYAHLPGSDVLTLSPVDGVTITTVTTGQGMTHAFALAEDFMAELTA